MKGEDIKKPGKFDGYVAVAVVIVEVEGEDLVD